MLPEIIFTLAALVIFYTYLGYPLLLWAWGSFRPNRKIAPNPWTPSVSLIIAARNEEKHIQEKLENCFQLDYPPEKLEIIVASDASEDATEEIARRYAARGVKVVRLEERGGKTLAQNAAVRESSGEVIVFSDATAHFRPDSLRRFVEAFDAQGRIGCVSGRVIFQRHASESYEEYRTYWNWELKLQMLESRLGFIPGVAGCMHAMRREAYTFLEPYAVSDFLQPLSIGYQGSKVIMQPEAISLEWREQGLMIDFFRRRRTVARAVNGISKNPHFINPRKNGRRAWQIISHKVLRWFSPFSLLLLLAASLFLPLQILSQTVLLLFLLLAVQGILGILLRGQPIGRPLRAPAYFLLANISSLLGVWDWLRGQHYVTWEPQR